MSLLVHGGILTTPEGSRRQEILCEGELISAVLPCGERPHTDDAIDASGLLVFPGFIDPHVHSRDPGMTWKEDFAHSTQAAAAGGITTLLEMPNAIPPVTDAVTLEVRSAEHQPVAAVDFGLWGLSLGPANLDELESLFDHGAVAVKLFWGYGLDRVTKELIYNTADAAPESVILPPHNGEVLRVFREVARVGGLLAAHCEDRAILERALQDLGHPILSYRDLLDARPVVAETSAIAIGIEFARATGCRFHVVHLSCERGLQLIRRAQREALAVTAETCPHYLTLTEDSYGRIGPVMKVYPPVRTETDQEALWDGVRDGSITSIGSDHAPHAAEDRQGELGRQPAGTVGVETMVPVVLNEMRRGRVAPERVAWALSEGTARLFGIFPRKGAVRPGSDADLTLVDLTATRVIINGELHSKNPLSPWNGVRVHGSPVMSVLRGAVLMRDGEMVGDRRGVLVRARHRAGGRPHAD
jgi:dihydroorotase